MSPVSQNALKIGGTVAAHALFWGWNLLFLSVIAFGVGPVLLFDTLRAAWMGVIPWSIAIFVPLLLLVPVLGMLIGGVFFRRDGGRLLSLFFGVQFPLQTPPNPVRCHHQRQFCGVSALLPYEAPVAARLLSRDRTLFVQIDRDTSFCQIVRGRATHDTAPDNHNLSLFAHYSYV